MAQGAKVGAGYGAVAGAGSAEGGLSERITGAGVGAAGGALAGAAVPLAARAVRRGAESLSRNARRLPAANRTLPATRGLDRDESKLAELFAADKKSPQTIRTQTEFLGDEGMLVDVGGPNVRGAARYAATKPGPAKSQMTEALTGRVWNEDEAIRSSVRQKFGNKSADEATQELEARMSTEAKPLYEAAYARGIIQNPVVDELLSRPAGRVAFKAAQRSAADEGVALPSGVVDVRALDYVKRSLDDRVSALLRTGKKDKARIVKNLRRDLLKEIDRAVPEYAQARATYAGPARSREMIRLGSKFLSREAPDLERQMARMSEADREFFRLGVKQKVMGILETGGRNRSRAAMLESPKVQARLEAVLGPEEFAEMEADIARRVVFRATKQDVLGNSNTFPRAMEAADMEGIPAERMIQAVAEPRRAVITAAINAVQRRRMGLAGKRAEKIAELLRLSPNDPRLADLLARIEAAERKTMTPGAKRGRVAMGAASRALAIGAGSSR